MADRTFLAGAVVLGAIGFERLVSAALLSSREIDFAVRVVIGVVAIVLAVVLGVRGGTQARRSR